MSDMPVESAPDPVKENGVSGEVVDAIHLMAQGKRNMMCAEVVQAMQQFQEAARILSAKYGEMADECADAYCCYGKALLEMARMEGGLLGDTAATGSEESQSENEENEEQEGANGGGGTEDGSTGGEEEEEGVLSEDIDDEDAELSKGKEKEGREEGKEKEEDKNKTEDRSKTTEKDAKNGTPAGEADGATASAAGCSRTEQPQNEDGDDVSNLQLAWEMMELAKVIYSRHDNREMKLKLADTYLKLGEIGMETEQFEQAIVDLESSLALLRANLAPEDRLIAETLYQLGLARQLSRQYDRAVLHLRAALRVLENRTALQRRVVAGDLEPAAVSGAATPSDGFYSPKELAQREIEQMTEIMPDILAKIDDVLDEKQNAEKVRSLMSESVPLSRSSCSSSTAPAPAALSAASPAKMAANGDSFGSSVFQASTTNIVPVNNISHLIRKKRKSTEDESDDIKRVRTESPASSAVVAPPIAAAVPGASQPLTGEVSEAGPQVSGDVHPATDAKPTGMTETSHEVLPQSSTTNGEECTDRKDLKSATT